MPLNIKALIKIFKEYHYVKFNDNCPSDVEAIITWARTAGQTEKEFTNFNLNILNMYNQDTGQSFINWVKELDRNKVLLHEQPNLTLISADGGEPTLRIMPKSEDNEDKNIGSNSTNTYYNAISEWFSYNISLHKDGISNKKKYHLHFAIRLHCSIGYVEFWCQDKKIDVNQYFENRFTPLMEAAKEGLKNIVKFLLERGANVNAQSNNGATALLLAIYNGHEEIALHLIEKGANVNLKTTKDCNYHKIFGGSIGDTPLHAAVRLGNIKIVEKLLEKGAEIHACSNGMTPLMEVFKSNMQLTSEENVYRQIDEFYKLHGNEELKLEPEMDNINFLEKIKSMITMNNCETKRDGITTRTDLRIMNLEVLIKNLKLQQAKFEIFERLQKIENLDYFQKITTQNSLENKSSVDSDNNHVDPKQLDVVCSELFKYWTELKKDQNQKFFGLTFFQSDALIAAEALVKYIFFNMKVNQNHFSLIEKNKKLFDIYNKIAMSPNIKQLKSVNLKNH